MQLTELGGFAERMRWEKVVYLERESTRKKRPQLEALMEAARRREFDVVLVWKLDRFGRSVQELVANIQDLDRAGIRFIAPSQSLDTDQRNPTSKLLLHILASVAEFERDLIRERVTAGLAEYRRAFKAGHVGKSKHSRSGKDLAPHRPAKVFDRAEAHRLRSKEGLSWRAIAKRLGVDQSTIRRAVRGVSKV
jgi:DNA invertase Pin-like site-specific DNA recombinase